MVGIGVIIPLTGLPLREAAPFIPTCLVLVMMFFLMRIHLPQVARVVTLDQIGTANNVSFSGVTNSPTFTGAFGLTMAGDLTLDDDLAFTVTGDLTFTSSGNITVELGSIARSLPDFYFPNSSGTIQINTGSAANTVDRVVFGNITVSTAGVTFRVEGNNLNSNAKTFGVISLPANCSYSIRAPMVVVSELVIAIYFQVTSSWEMAEMETLGVIIQSFREMLIWVPTVRFDGVIRWNLRLI